MANKGIKNKKLLIIAILFLVLVILIPIGFALFSHTKEEDTTTKIGEIKVELVEDWPDRDGTYTNDEGETETYDEFGISKKTKAINGHSVSELDAYVRVRLIPIVEYYVEKGDSGEWITAPVSQDKFVINVTEDTNDTETSDVIRGSWVKSGDYWYFTKVLPGFKDTSKMNISWQVAEIPSEIASYPIRTNVRVLLEYAQTTNNMWKELFQIDSLPEGVELVE